MPATLDPVKDHRTGGGSSFSAEVIVRDDDKFPVEVVLAALCKVLPGYDLAKAIDAVKKIEANVEHPVWSGAREVCELYAEQLNAAGLDARVR